MPYGHVSVDVALAVGHVVTERTPELGRDAALEAHVALHAVQVGVTTQAARALVTLRQAVHTCARKALVRC